MMRDFPSIGGCCCGAAHGTTALQAVDIAAFDVDPVEAIDFLRRKLDMPTAAWTDLWQEQHSVAFTVAGATNKAIVRDFHDAVDRAIADGATLADFRRDFDRIVEDHGWSYNGSRNWRARVIIDTNISTAYAAGKWQQIQRVKQSRPYLRYVHLAGQKNPRPEHEAWDGLILPVDDDWWLTHYPPNGWFCHCTVMSLSERDLARYGYQVSEAPETVMVEQTITTPDGIRTVTTPEGIDPGFAYRPGAMPAEAIIDDDGEI
ncbi:MAG: hypothetical protein H7312_02050 [Tardiphaga sp.]|nr:hypothetical protein [Tardiphaga sp.]